MSTNYYLHKNICESCGRSDIIHVGKSAAGWRFLFHIDENHKNAKEWIDDVLDPRHKLYNEYGKEVNKEKWVECVKAKSTGTSQGGEYGCTTDGMYDYTESGFS